MGIALDHQLRYQKIQVPHHPRLLFVKNQVEFTEKIVNLDIQAIDKKVQNEETLTCHPQAHNQAKIIQIRELN